jgi:hypothetical protein
MPGDPRIFYVTENVNLDAHIAVANAACFDFDPHLPFARLGDIKFGQFQATIGFWKDKCFHELDECKPMARHEVLKAGWSRATQQGDASESVHTFACR